MSAIEKDHLCVDVLIVGAGVAGITAAIEAQDQGADVLLVTKGAFGRDGAATWTSGYGFQVALNPPDSPEIHFADTVKVGRYLNDQKLVHRLILEIIRQHQNLDQWGVRYLKENGRYLMMRLPGESYPRVPRLTIPGEWAGQEYRRSLTRQVKKRRIRVIEDLFILDLIATRDGIAGAVGLDLRKGTFLAIQAKETILATGGHMGSYRTTTIPQASGDGSAAAFRAGIALTDMEFADFYAYTAIWPPVTVGEIWPSVFRYELNGKLLNSLGEDLREKYRGPERVPPLAIEREVKAGRGSPHGGAYLSIRHNSPEEIERVLARMGHPKWLKRLQAMGFDVAKQDIEVAPAGIVSFGGCKVDEDCATDTPGLYAAGEVAASREGAYTNAGNSLPLSMAMGAIAGREAGARIKKGRRHVPLNGHVDELCQNALRPILREKGIRPVQFRRKLQEILAEHGSLIGRTEQRFTEGLEKIRQIKKSDLDNMCVTVKDRTFNLEWREALEVRNIVDVTELILTAARERKESRGLHYREDFPKEDKTWLKHVVLRKDREEIKTTAEPVIFPYLSPPES
ncbi:MAG: FAD-binding protein [Deltaproteobacteria bacterium]|nr:FAD-binding protein [Deltaproteobacteria bacterium]